MQRSGRSSSTPITNLGRGSSSSTWNPVESYTVVSTSDSIDTPLSMAMSIFEKQNCQTSHVDGDLSSKRGKCRVVLCKRLL